MSFFLTIKRIFLSGKQEHKMKKKILHFPLLFIFNVKEKLKITRIHKPYGKMHLNIIFQDM